MFRMLKELGKAAVQTAVMAPVVVSIAVIGASFLLLTGGGNICEKK